MTSIHSNRGLPIPMIGGNGAFERVRSTGTMARPQPARPQQSSTILGARVGPGSPGAVLGCSIGNSHNSLQLGMNITNPSTPTSPAPEATSSVTLRPTQEATAHLRPYEPQPKVDWTVSTCVWSDDLQSFVYISTEKRSFPVYEIPRIQEAATRVLNNLCKDTSSKRSILPANELIFDTEITAEGARSSLDTVQWISDKRPNNKTVRSFLQQISRVSSLITKDPTPLLVERNINGSIPLNEAMHHEINRFSKTFTDLPSIERPEVKKHRKTSVEQAREIRAALTGNEPVPIKIKEHVLVELQNGASHHIELHPTVHTSGENVTSEVGDIMAAGNSAFIPVSLDTPKGKHAVTIYVEKIEPSWSGPGGWTIHVYDPLNKADHTSNKALEKVVTQIKSQFIGTSTPFGSWRVGVEKVDAPNHQKDGQNDCARFQLLFFQHLTQGDSVSDWAKVKIESAQVRCKELADLVAERLNKEPAHSG